jgi:hypothetical protein
LLPFNEHVSRLPVSSAGQNDDYTLQSGDATIHILPHEDLQSQPSSTDTFDSGTLSTPRELYSSLETSVLFEEIVPLKLPPADYEQSGASNLAATEKMNGHGDKRPADPQVHEPKLNANGIPGEWDDEASGRVPDGPITKIEFLQRQQEKLRSTYKKLKHMRERNLDTRLRAHQLRNLLKGKREIATGAEADLMKALNTFFAQNTSEEVEGLRVLYERCRHVRDDYQPLEDSYNTLEDQVDEEEFELDMAEKRLYERQNNASELGESTIPVDYESSQSSVASDDPFIEYPSVVMEYFDRAGDEELARERLQDHRNRRAILVETERYRSRHGLVLDDDSKSFLDTFDTVHESLQKALAEVESSLGDLAKQCVEQDLWGMVDHSGLDELLLPGEEIRSLDDFLKLEDDVDELRMSSMTVGDTVQDTGLINRTKWINNWLYRSLRGSRQEIWRLKDTVRWYIPLDAPEVSKRILEWWDKDQAALSSVLPANSMRGYSTLSAKDNPLRNAISSPSQADPPDGSEILRSRSV